MSFLLTLNIANALAECLPIDFEQVYFSLYGTNYLPVVASKAWSKQTFTFYKVLGAFLNAFLICSALESEDTFINVSLDCFWQITNLFQSYNGIIEHVLVENNILLLWLNSKNVFLF